MIKKCNFLVALVGMAVSTSCSMDELQPNNGLSSQEIKVNTSFSLPMQSRATETVIGNLGAFYMTAFQDGKANYMEQVKYSSTDNGNTWNTDKGTFFWPVNDDLYFYAYAPETPGQTGTFSLSKDAQNVTSFSPCAKAEDQKDFVFAQASGNVKDNGSTGVEINFKHALSEITVKAKNDNAAYSVVVTGVKLGNIISKGDFTFPTITGTDAKWTLSSTASDVVDYSADVTQTTLASDATVLGEPFMILPQQLEKADIASEKSNIAVKVKITTQGGAELYDNWVYAGIDQKWEMGMHYIYTLDFSNGAGQDKDGNQVISGSAIKLNVTVTPWKEFGGNDIKPDMSGVVPPHKAKANSLIVNPSSEKVYGIDIADRINTFWNSAEGNASNILTESTEWEADVVWQDINSRAINFCTEDGTVQSGDTYSGTGLTPLYIKPVGNNASGNVVIGVKKKGETDYLWSWHLWLTDYDPSISTPW